MNRPSSSHANMNGESPDGSLKRMVENLSQSNQQLLQTIEELRAVEFKASTFHKYCSA